MTRMQCPRMGMLTAFALLLLAPAAHPAENSISIERMRKDQNTTYDGPDVVGNARNYGRALFTSQHFTGGDVWKLKGREYLLDDTQSLAVVWEAFKGDMLTHVHVGQLFWEGN